MLDTSTAAGQAEIARLLQDLQTGDDAARDIAASALPAHLPGVHLASALGGVAGASCYHAFTTGAFDANTLRQFAAGIALSADDRNERERKQNGGMTQAERLDALLDGMSDITDAQKEAMKAYRQTWLNEEHDYGGTKMTGRDIEEMNDRYRNDPRFRNSVHSKLRDEGLTVAQILALENASDRKRTLSQIPEHARTPAQQAEFIAAQNNTDLNRFEARVIEDDKKWTSEAKSSPNNSQDEANIPPFSDRVDKFDDKTNTEDYATQSNVAGSTNQLQITRKEPPASAPSAPLIATI